MSSNASDSPEYFHHNLIKLWYEYHWGSLDGAGYHIIRGTKSLVQGIQRPYHPHVGGVGRGSGIIKPSYTHLYMTIIPVLGQNCCKHIAWSIEVLKDS